jgi:hypothetical protein
MNIAIPINDFSINNVFFQDAINNTVMNDSIFIRIVYSDALCAYNGICLETTIPITHIDKSFNKFKCYYDKQSSNTVIQAICNIEKNIIDNCNIKNKTPIFRLREQLKTGYIKVMEHTSTDHKFTDHKFTDHKFTDPKTLSNNFIIKISGIWTSLEEYGLTYRFLECGESIKNIT